MPLRDLLRQLVTSSTPTARFLAGSMVVYSSVILLTAQGVFDMPIVPDTLYMVFRGTTAYVMWAAASASTVPTISQGWRLLALGQVVAVFGNATWVVSDITGEPTSNAAYLAWTLPQNALNVAGFWRLMMARDDPAARLGDWVDAAVVVVACTAVAWYFIVADLLTASRGSTVDAFLVGYDTATNAITLLFAVTVWLRSPRGVAPNAMPRMVLALLMLAGADLVLERMFATNTYTPGSAINLWYAASVCLLALGADEQRRNPRGGGKPAQAADRSDAVALGAVLAALVPLVMEIGDADVATRQLMTAGLGVAVLMLLVLWRQRLARREIEALIAGRLRLQHQLWQAQKLESVGNLAGGIAHDFNNILAAIAAHAYELREQSSGAAQQAVREIEYATQRAAVVVRRLLTFSRADSPDRTAIELGPAVRAMHALLRQFTSAEIEIVLAVEDDGAVVTLADGQLEQILMNFVINARDASPRGGRITVTTRRAVVHPRDPLHRRGLTPGHWAVLEVADTGVGMTPETQARLFEPYFTTKAETGGTGLGLATVAGIVHAAEGQIHVDSAPGAGTRISVFLPVSAIRSPSASDATGVDRMTLPRSGAARGTVLVVNDDLPIRAALARYLSRIGHRVLEAADCAQARSQFEQAGRSVDLVLTDWRLSDGTAAEIAAHVRRERPGIALLIISADVAAARRESGGVVAAEDLIEKPFDLEVVAARVGARIADARQRSR